VYDTENKSINWKVECTLVEYYTTLLKLTHVQLVKRYEHDDGGGTLNTIAPLISLFLT